MPFIITIVAIVLTDLLKGVIIGIAVGLFYVIRSNFRTAVFSVQDGDYHLVRLRKDVSFFIKPLLKETLEKIPANSNLVLDLTRAEFIDKDVIETINEFTQHAHLKNIIVTVNKSLYNESHQLIEHAIALPKPEDDSAH
ncbi:MAG: hypothetical protein BWY67_01755 [Bacteroidetes bacterium ADurb.Bin397]|nr:MAG: hypothetical protein BWY67_01755 [Bacteroidetes bacterium ADurb.Bin397]